MLTRDISEMDRLIVGRLHDIRALPFDVVVHIPRSGTLPAALIATHLRKPLASVEEFCQRIVPTRKSDVGPTLNRALVVDDSIRTGFQMEEALKRVKRYRRDVEICTLAVFSTRVPRTLQPDLVLAEHEEGHYLYPWFMWKTKRVEHCAVDMDGVLCRDCTREEDDDGEQYARFLETADLKFFTPFKVGAIVTSRLERYRPQTEAWLRRHGFSYDALIMGPWPTQAARRGDAMPWKARIYADLPQLLYIESDDRTARSIATLAGKPTWSIEMQRRHG